MEVSSGQFEATDHIHSGGLSRGTMKIANTAEFYHLLSDALYTHKELAVIREILCNAHDAHIASGRTDTPIQVTLNDEDGMKSLSIRDYGFGIPNDEIIEIYGTYGNSTKRKNALETGGFGLGSKAPFAITGHFNVTNHHDGKKTLYKILKEGAGEEGKPDIIEVVSVPSEETGVEVTIPIKDYNQEHNLVDLVKSIAFIGGMNVQLTNYASSNKLETIDWSQGNLVIVQNNVAALQSYTSLIGASSLYIKLGAVIYPVPRQLEFKELFVLYDKMRSKINSNSEYPVVIIQVPGNSVRVTPSREALSLNNMTISNINKYCMEAISQFLHNSQGAIKRAKEVNPPCSLSELHKERSLGKCPTLLDKSANLINSTQKHFDNLVYVTRFNNLTIEQRMIFNYPKLFRKLKYSVINRRYITNQQLNKSFLKNLSRVFGDYEFNKNKTYLKYSYGSMRFVDHISNYDLITPVVFIAYSKKGLQDYFQEIKSNNKITDKPYYVIYRHLKDDLDEKALIEKAEKLGITLYFQPKPIKKKPEKRTPKAVPITSHGEGVFADHVNDYDISSDSVFLKYGMTAKVDISDIKNYYVIPMRACGYHTSKYYADKNILNIINDLNKVSNNKIIFIHKASQWDLFKKHGAKDIQELINNYVLKYKFSTATEVAQLITWENTYAGYRDTIYIDRNDRVILELAAMSPKIMKKFLGVRLKKSESISESLQACRIFNAARRIEDTSNFTDVSNKVKEFREYLTKESPICKKLLCIKDNKGDGTGEFKFLTFISLVNIVSELKKYFLNDLIPDPSKKGFEEKIKMIEKMLTTTQKQLNGF